MLVLRYFVVVGAVLLALLFVAGEAFPTLPTTNVADTAATDVSVIRIHSDRKWPERVVFDTSAPTMPLVTVTASVPVQTRTANNVMRAADIVDTSVKVTARDAFAQIAPSDLKPSDLKKSGVTSQTKRQTSKRHLAPAPVQFAQRPQLGLFANNIW